MSSLIVCRISTRQEILNKKRVGFIPNSERYINGIFLSLTLTGRERNDYGRLETDTDL